MATSPPIVTVVMDDSSGFREVIRLKEITLMSFGIVRAPEASVSMSNKSGHAKKLSVFVCSLLFVMLRVYSPSSLTKKR